MNVRVVAVFAGVLLAFLLVGCGSASAPSSSSTDGSVSLEASDHVDASASPAVPPATTAPPPGLLIVQDFRPSFVHGEKPADKQKYIVLHDTEGESDALHVVEYWDASGAGIASHFVVNHDGGIVQCVPLDKIAHHAGYGDTGHNAAFGIVEDGRDDMVGSTPIGDWAADYGMNAWSIGIELVHVGGQGEYPEAQLQALDSLIAYIDSCYGTQSAIIDHKAWRTGNSDTSEEFAPFLANYQNHRTHL